MFPNMEEVHVFLGPSSMRGKTTVPALSRLEESGKGPSSAMDARICLALAATAAGPRVASGSSQAVLVVACLLGSAAVPELMGSQNVATEFSRLRQHCRYFLCCPYVL